jgi:hypothetical protein
LTAWENGPTGGASSGEVIAVLLIATPVATSVADRIHKRTNSMQYRWTNNIQQVHYFHNDVSLFALS